jgi:YVTN family beta-propeller protein
MKKSAFFATALFMSLVALVPAGAFAKTNRNAYVANNLNGTVDVIDTRTDAIIATISGFTHPSDMAVSPNGKLLYVRNSNSTISVVDTEANLVKTTISFPAGAANEGAGPTLVFNGRGDRVYFANSLDNLVVIDVENSTVLQTMPLPAGFGPTCIAVSRDNDNVYVGSGQAAGILVIDADGDAATTTIAPGHLILDLALSPDGKKLYASDSSGLLSSANSNGVLVFNTDTNTLEATVPLPGSPSDPAFVTGLAVTPDGRHLYVEDFFFTHSNSTVTVIDTHDNSVDTTITANGLSLTSLAITTNGKKVLATNAILSATVDSTVAVIGTRDNTIDDSITVGHFADTIATQPSRHQGDDDGRDDDGHGDHDR